MGGSHHLGKKHGGKVDDAFLTIITLGEGEQIAQLKGWFGAYLNKLTITTFKRGNGFSAYGPFGYDTIEKHFETY